MSRRLRACGRRCGKRHYEKQLNQQYEKRAVFTPLFFLFLPFCSLLDHMGTARFPFGVRYGEENKASPFWVTSNSARPMESTYKL